MMKLPRSVLFDWDNTLVDSLDCIRVALDVMYDQMKLKSPLEDPQVGQAGQAALSLRDSFPAMFRDRWSEARDIFYNYYRDNHLKDLKAKPGAEQLLAKVARHGLYMAVVSNKEGDLLRREVKNLGWGGFFTQVVGASDASADKPDPAPVVMALQQARLGRFERSQVWFIGDSEVDVECAHRSGCLSLQVGMAAGRETDGLPGNCFVPDYRFTDCQAVAEMMPD